jgi:alpha-ketoglutarate-dependent taurine dioxygenase
VPELALSRRAVDELVERSGGGTMTVEREMRYAAASAAKAGAAVVRGLPGDLTSTLYLRAAATLGDLLVQDPAGTVAYSVRSSGYDLSDLRSNRSLRGAATAAALPLHTDSAPHFGGRTPDIIALIALRCAPEGGDTLLASSYAVHNELRNRSIALLRRAYQRVPFDRRDEGDPLLLAPIFTFHKRALRMRYSDFYIREGIRRSRIVSPLMERALHELAAITTEPALMTKFRLSEGDVLLIDNRWVLHGRTNFVDSDRQTRHLLRIWIHLR